jgi:hypothetical protein
MLAFALAAGISIAGLTAGAQPLEGTPIVAADYRWSAASGSATLSGLVALSAERGAVRSCAGFNVALVPSGNQTDAYIVSAFGAKNGGYHDATVPLPIPPAGLHGIDRQTVCDAQGRFSFSGVPAGVYYVIGPVLWVDASRTDAPPAVVGGLLMQRVSLKDGESRSVSLSHEAGRPVALAR